jgi:hypothetical protein
MPRPAIPKPQVVPLAEGAKYACVCKTTLRNWIAAGLITGHRRGPKLLFVDLAEIDAMTRPVTVRASGQ